MQQPTSDFSERMMAIESCFNAHSKDGRQKWVEEAARLTSGLQITILLKAVDAIKKLKDFPGNVGAKILQLSHEFYITEHNELKKVDVFAEAAKNSESIGRYLRLCASTHVLIRGYKTDYYAYWKNVNDQWMNCHNEDQYMACMEYAEGYFSHIKENEAKEENVIGGSQIIENK